VPCQAVHRDWNCLTDDLSVVCSSLRRSESVLGLLISLNLKRHLGQRKDTVITWQLAQNVRSIGGTVNIRQMGVSV